MAVNNRHLTARLAAIAAAALAVILAGVAVLAHAPAAASPARHGSNTGAAAGASPARPLSWRLSRTFGAGAVDDISASSSHDAWLAGGRSSRVVVRRWTAGRWRVVRTPREMFTEGGVIVGGNSAANAWAFTLTRPAVTASYSVGWHWTGRGWQRFRLPDGTSIAGTAVFSRTNAWAFGQQLSARGKLAPYVARYRGSAWHRVAAPVRPAAVSVLAANDIWIVGPAQASVRSTPRPYAAADWTGSSWLVRTLPQVKVRKHWYALAPSILALSRTSVFVDFEVCPDSGTGECAVALLHYNGAAWTQLAVPRWPVTRLSPMAADGHGGIWIAIASSRQYGSALVDYRDGRWSVPHVLAKPGRDVLITSLATPPGSTLTWAAGDGGSRTGARGPRMVLYEYSH
jgi:hypothetical protein